MSGVAMRIACTTSPGRISGVETLRPTSPFFSFRPTRPLSSLLRSMITFPSVVITRPDVLPTDEQRHVRLVIFATSCTTLLKSFLTRRERE